MTFAWYGHLKKDLSNISLIKLVLISWGIAFFEYCFMVPANNKYGTLEGYSPFQLKTIQELISLLVFFVFAMFFLGMFWKRTTGLAAVVGLLTGVSLCIFFNEFAPQVFGNETFLYTAYPNGKGAYEIPFLIAMGISFALTVIVMAVISLAGPKVSPNAFILDKTMFKLRPSNIALIVVVLLILFALYIKFW